MNSINRLTEFFRRFPGIGPRQAKRFVYFLLTQSPRELKALAEAIQSLRSDVRTCTLCYRYFMNGGGSTCAICSDTHRDSALLMIVEKDVDLDNIERTGAFTGRYFVLGGSIPILDTEPEKHVRLRELTKRIENEKSQIAEVILALSLTPEGEHTKELIAEKLSAVVNASGTRISTLGRGLSTGSELEYSDPETIKFALSNRK